MDSPSKGIYLSLVGGDVLVASYEGATICYKDHAYMGRNLNSKGPPKRLAPLSDECAEPYLLSTVESIYLFRNHSSTFSFSAQLVAFLQAELLCDKVRAYYHVYEHFRRHASSGKALSGDDNVGFIKGPLILKDGFKYGVDFLLYDADPAVVHAKYGVIIDLLAGDDVDQSGNCLSLTSSSFVTSSLDTRFLLSTLRVMHQVGKKLLLVRYDLAKHEILSIQVLSRWLPSLDH